MNKKMAQLISEDMKRFQKNMTTDSTSYDVIKNAVKESIETGKSRNESEALVKIARSIGFDISLSDLEHFPAGYFWHDQTINSGS